MNITTLFRTHYKDQLLFNVVGENVTGNWNINKLFTNIGKISRVLRKNKIKPEDRIAILTGNRVETFEFTLAVFNIGSIAVPLNPYIGHDALLEIVRNIRPKCCFYEGSLNQDLLRILDSTCKLYIVVNRTYELDGIIQLSYEDLLSHDYPIKYGSYSDTHPALIIHTSGSQGHPKIIRMSHKNLFYYFHYHDLVHRQFTDSWGEGAIQKPIISVFQPSHLASYSIVLQGLLMRRPTYLMRDFSPRSYLMLLSSLGCRLSILIPAMYANLLKQQSLINNNDYSALELSAAVGEQIPDLLASKVEQNFGVTCFSGYGLTECLPGIAHTWEDLHKKRIPRGSCGKVLFGEVKLIDEKGNDSNIGELWLRNPTIHSCYTDDRLNQDKIDANGWLRTGDVFYGDEDGYFYHKGRVDDMFVFNGKNIYPAEIESALIKYPAIQNAVAAAVLDLHGKHIPAALIQTKVDLNQSEVINYFIKTGPLYALPKFIKTMKELPQLGSGKIDRVASKKLLQDAFRISEENDII